MSVAAHDLRNPIAVVRASAQMAQRQLSRGDPEAAQVRLRGIVQQTDRLSEMLETFLDAARIGTGHLPLRPERMQLREVAELAAERARLLLGEPSTRPIEYHVPEDCIGTWDRPRVQRAVQALVTNALLYGEASEPVTIAAHRDGEYMCISVSGGGPGPTDEEVEHLFERFYRGPSAAQAGQSGSGLGLFTARGIARLHGGDVRRVGGDTFEILLPLADST
jgi:signal transduction histidine kinase